MQIVDAQVHVWSTNTPDRPWPPGYKPHRPVPLTPSLLLEEMNAAGVDCAVLVPSQMENYRNDRALEGACAHPDRLTVMGRLDLLLPEARASIAAWCNQPGMRGLRCSFIETLWGSAVAEGRMDWFWPEAEKAGMPIMLMMHHDQLHMVDKVAQRYPACKLTLDHLALDSSKRDDDAFRDLDKLLALAKRPNIMVKVSALPTYTTDSYPFRRLHPYVRRVYDAFGPARMFWGTDLSRLTCSYRQAVTMFTEEMDWLSATDKEWIMGRGICEWLGWNPGKNHVE